jgi:hypothetical protein
MDTIQVDAKKLQLLNDRINQTIDALSQLRVTAQQAGVGLGHSTLGAPVSPYAQYAAAFGQGVPGVYGYPQAMIDPSIFARQQAMQAMMAQWAAGGLGHTTLPQGAFGPTLPVATPAIPAAYAAQCVPGVYGYQGYQGYQQPIWGAGLGHTTARYPVAELLCGACDPALRQVEFARAHEANRAWELSQGLGHTTLPNAQAALFAANPFACSPFVAAQYPWGFGNASVFGC